MPAAFPIALTGFTAFELATFESVFRLAAARREPAYCLADDLEAAALVIANADSDRAVAQVQQQGLLPRALMLGSTPRAGAGQQLPRPINPMLVLRALDTLVRQGVVPASLPAAAGHTAFDDTVPAALGPAQPQSQPQSQPQPQPQPAAHEAAMPAQSAGSVFTVSHSLAALAQTDDGEELPSAVTGVSGAVQRVLDDLMHVTTTLSAATDTRALAAAAAASAASAAVVATAGAPLAAASPPAPVALAAAPGRPGLDHILIVDSSDVALRFMSAQLQRFGFEVHLARSGAQALERVARRHFAFVFIDVTMHGIDGLHTCKLIKRQAAAGSLPGPAPTVVLMTTRSHVADRLRFARAGADTCLVKPLREAELLKIVGDREVTLHAYAETAGASSMLSTLI